MDLNQKAIAELAKSFGRFVWFGLLGLVATFLTSLVTNGSLADAHVTLAGVSLNVGFLLTVSVGFVVKALDRYRHYDETPSKGLAPQFLQR